MSVVVVTAFAMSGLAFTIPVAVRQIARPFSPAELSDFLRVQRVFATFLAYLAGVTLASGWQGISRRTIAVFRDLLAELATLAGSPPDVLSQEVGATHPDHTKRSASLLAVLGQALAHNSYHIGQVVMMRSSLGAWPPKGGGDSW